MGQNQQGTFEAPAVDSKLPADQISFFKSTVQTGTGASQSIAHGLARVPALVIVLVNQTISATTVNWAEGTHDATNLQISATSTSKYVTIAL